MSTYITRTDTGEYYIHHEPSDFTHLLAITYRNGVVCAVGDDVVAHEALDQTERRPDNDHYKHGLPKHLCMVCDFGLTHG